MSNAKQKRERAPAGQNDEARDFATFARMTTPSSHCLLAALALLGGCGDCGGEAKRAELPTPSSTVAGKAPGEHPAAAQAPSAHAPEEGSRTSSGLAYRVLEPGRGGRSPAPHDQVTLDFIGWDARGKVIESSKQRGFPSVVKVSETMPGWAEALSTMTVGEKRRLWLAPGLGYRNRPGRPAEPAVFDLELVSFAAGTPPAPAPPDVAAPPQDATRTASGLAYKRLKRGPGKRSPGPHDHVELLLSAWTTEGESLEGDAHSGMRTTRTVRKQPPGLAEGLQRMVVGDATRFWIPEALGGSYPGKHRGMRVYDIELVAIERMPDPPPTPKEFSAPANARKTASGIAYVTRVKGKPTKPAGERSTVVLNVTVWAEDGTLISSTQTESQQSEIKLHDTTAELRELLMGMTLGERRHVWIRDDQMYYGNPSRELRIVDVELVSIL